ncbi:MAG: thioredoxin family protein [Terracidiphilus sp.]|jgi:thiol:disulfide interchange protein DsbD
MRRFRLIFALIAVLAAVPLAFAASNSADVAHLHVQLVVPNQNLNTGTPVNAGLYFKLESGWHVYWKNAGDSGEPPHIQWTLPAGITASAMQFPAPQRLPLGPLMDFGYENEVLFPFTVKAAATAKPGSAVLHAKADWLVCREVCIPGKAELDQNVNVVSRAPVVNLISPSDQELWNRLANALPKALPSSDTAIFQPTPTGFRLAVTTGKRETEAEFFPEDEDILDNPAPQTVTSTAAGFVLDLKKDANLTSGPAQLKGVLELAGGRNYEIAATPGTVAAPPAAPALSLPGTVVAPPAAPAFSFAALASTVFFAFLGGLLLNLMPCVFPVLFLKGLALVQSGAEERHKLRAHGLVYTAGILVSFWALVALLLVLRAAGATLGWGFQFQSPVFLALMAALLFFLGLSLAGQFEIGLTLTSAGGALVTENGAAKQGYAGSFFTGVLAVIVATPCTAPFMGAAIGYALAQTAAVTFAIFTALALGLAAPYIALTLQPAWTRVLPKPGVWMEILKQAVSVPIFGTVIWLTWVVAEAYGANLLLALLSIFLLLGIAGWFLGRWPAQRWSTLVAALLLLTVLVACVTAPRELAEAPATLSAQLSSESFAARSAAAWQPWSAVGVQHALAAGQPVFVDFTATWCLSCQVNERIALSQPEVMQAFGAKNVALFKADWTREDPAITQELTALGRSGVPVYALYSPGENNPRLLPQVLTPGIVLDAINELSSGAATPASAAPSKQQ